MSKFPEKAKIGIPNKRYQHKFNNFHESSTGFMLPNVPFFLPVNGKDSINMNFDDFNKLNPMPIPTLGMATIKFAWYFVPRRIIFNRSKEMMTETIVHGLPNNALYVTNAPNFNYEDLFNYIIRYNSYLAEPVKDANNNDIVVTALNWANYFGPEATEPGDFVDQNDHLFRLTAKGVQVATILNQLGYPISTRLIGDKDDPNYVNAEPILAFCKVMLDHYIPRYWDSYTNNFNNLYQIIESIDDYANSHIGTAWISEFVELCTIVCYNDDYFTTAWNNPAGPNSIKGTTISGISGTIDDLISQNPFAALKPLVSSGQPVIAQQDLNTLKALDKYLKKNQIVGCKYWDRMLAHFGISTEKALLRVSDKIKEDTYPIHFSDVVSTAETLNGGVGDNLGSYAGKGEAWIPNVCHFEYSWNEPGFIIAIKTIVPDVAYANNAENYIFKLHKLDFYNEEFDAIGTEPIHSLELYSGYDLIASDNMTDIFGFLPRYASFKSMKNKVTGKLSLPSKRPEFEKWTFLRWFSRGSFSNVGGTFAVQTTPGFEIGYNDLENISRTNFGMSQFDRIFYVPSEHNFYCYSEFDFSLKSLMKPLWSYDDIIDDNDKAITVSVGNKND